MGCGVPRLGRSNGESTAQRVSPWSKKRSQAAFGLLRFETGSHSDSEAFTGRGTFRTNSPPCIHFLPVDVRPELRFRFHPVRRNPTAGYPIQRRAGGCSPQAGESVGRRGTYRTASSRHAVSRSPVTPSKASARSAPSRTAMRIASAPHRPPDAGRRKRRCRAAFFTASRGARAVGDFAGGNFPVGFGSLLATSRSCPRPWCPPCRACRPA